MMLQDNSSIDHYAEMAYAVIHSATAEHCRPSVLFKPRLVKDYFKGSDVWMAVYGEMPTCVIGFGKTPEKAMLSFDKAWEDESGVDNDTR